MKIVRYFAFIFLGFVVGVYMTCYLSALASGTFLDLVKISYQNHEKARAANSMKYGDVDSAIFHYKNLVLSSTKNGHPCFQTNNEYWNFGFPFSAIVLRKIREGESPFGIRKKEGINRALLACSLEAGGFLRESKSEYIKAAKLLEYGDDVEKVKNLSKKIMSDDIKMLSSSVGRVEKPDTSDGTEKEKQ